MIRHSAGKSKEHEPTETEKEHMLKMKNVMTEFLKFRSDFKNSTKTLDEIFGYSLQMMHLSTDSPTIFNFRKDLILLKIEEIKSNKLENEEKLEICHKLVLTELKELFKLGISDPKSYEIWFHRIWNINLFSGIETQYSSELLLTKKLIQDDLLICEKYLKKDERNFHVWNYRLELNLFLLFLFENEKKGILDKELNFILAKIEDNFSNYSAIQFFTKYVQRFLELLKNDKEGFKFSFERLILPQINSNIEALVISPNEQASWLFQQWLINKLNSPVLIFAEKTENEPILKLVFNKKIEREVLKKSLKSDKNYSIENDFQNVYKLRFEDFLDNTFSCQINYENESKSVVIKIKNNKIEIENEKQNVDFFEYLVKIRESFSEIEVEANETLMFKPINAYLVNKEIELSKFFNDKEKLKEVLENLKSEFEKQLIKIAETNYSKKLIKRIQNIKNKLWDLIEFTSII